MMTRKDYRLIAAAIASARSYCNGNAHELAATNRVAAALVGPLGVDNSRFDPSAFLTACGVYDGQEEFP